MGTPFKMKGFSGFGNSPMRKDTWSERVFSAQRRGYEAGKRIKKQKESGDIEKLQDKISKGGKGNIPIFAHD